MPSHSSPLPSDEGMLNDVGRKDSSDHNPTVSIVFDLGPDFQFTFVARCPQGTAILDSMVFGIKALEELKGSLERQIAEGRETFSLPAAADFNKRTLFSVDQGDFIKVLREEGLL